jgi:hypothetical protein
MGDFGKAMLKFGLGSAKAYMKSGAKPAAKAVASTLKSQAVAVMKAAPKVVAALPPPKTAFKVGSSVAVLGHMGNCLGHGGDAAKCGAELGTDMAEAAKKIIEPLVGYGASAAAAAAKPLTEAADREVEKIKTSAKHALMYVGGGIGVLVALRLAYKYSGQTAS